MRLYNVAVVGATGLVGRKMVQVLEERKFPVGELRLLASERSMGKEVGFNGSTLPVQRLTQSSFVDMELALFSAGTTISKEFAPCAVKAGALVIDNSSSFRMDEHVPLVVPEVNKRMIFHHKGIIANPNCSTIQLVVALKPLHDRWKIKRVVVATYQSVTGAGQKGLDQLEHELAKVPVKEMKFPHQIAYNVLPHVDVFFDDGNTKEEYKMIHETRKIMGDDTIKVVATCVRVPVYGGHSEAVNVEFEKPFRIAEVRDALSHAPGVILQDDPHHGIYPMPIHSWEKDQVFVGRLRVDETVPHGLSLWIVSDNLRKGAATNAVQIAEEWIRSH
ncbi:MAG: aspartate-semialdehyde dehydrogenase [Ignavibacteriae bacterium]|nr:aspartate-semialdehyde dehydrogenase [Ignavibacteriota bacterium]